MYDLDANSAGKMTAYMDSRRNRREGARRRRAARIYAAAYTEAVRTHPKGGGLLGDTARALCAEFAGNEAVRKFLATAKDSGEWLWVLPSLMVLLTACGGDVASLVDAGPIDAARDVALDVRDAAVSDVAPPNATDAGNACPVLGQPCIVGNNDWCVDETPPLDVWVCVTGQWERRGCQLGDRQCNDAGVCVAPACK